MLCSATILPDTVSAMTIGKNTKSALGVTLSVEYDDNITLVKDADWCCGPAKEDDELAGEIVFHILPFLEITKFYNDHNLNLLLKGDYRDGGDIFGNEINLEAGAGVDLNFAGGLMFSLYDTYQKEEFDQRLYNEAGVSDNHNNTYGVKTGYSFGERTSIEVSYSHLWEEYDDVPDVTIYDTDTVNGKFTLPISTRWKSYLAATFETIESEKAFIRNNDDLQGMLGARWEGPNRFTYWLEGGFGKIDYENEHAEDFSEVIGETGVDIALSVWSFLQISLGLNSYGELKWAGMLRHNFADKLTLTLSANRDTVRSYSPYIIPIQYDTDIFDESFYNLSVFQIMLQRTFLENFEASLTASYRIQDADDSIETLIGKATLDYPIQDWLKAGIHYQYATRTASTPVDEYENNRIGLFVTLYL